MAQRCRGCLPDLPATPGLGPLGTARQSDTGAGFRHLLPGSATRERASEQSIDRRRAVALQVLAEKGTKENELDTRLQALLVEADVLRGQDEGINSVLLVSAQSEIQKLQEEARARTAELEDLANRCGGDALRDPMSGTPRPWLRWAAAGGWQHTAPAALLRIRSMLRDCAPLARGTRCLCAALREFCRPGDRRLPRSLTPELHAATGSTVHREHVLRAVAAVFPCAVCRVSWQNSKAKCVA
jgi:hypothetical protein